MKATKNVNESSSFGEWLFSEEVEDTVNTAVAVVGCLVFVGVIVRLILNWV